MHNYFLEDLRFKNNSPKNQFGKIIEELKELQEAIIIFQKNPTKENKLNIGAELMDSIESLNTMSNLYFTIAEQKQINLTHKSKMRTRIQKNYYINLIK